MTSPLVLPPQIPDFDKRWLYPKYWPVWLGFGFVWLLTFVPLRLRQALARFAGWLAYRLNEKRRHVVRVNLQTAFPALSDDERDQMARDHFSAMARSFLDMGFLWFSSDSKLLRQVDIDGEENLSLARKEGKQVIYHVAHVAGLEFGAVAVGSIEPAVGLYQSLENPLVNWQIARARHRFGNRIFRRKDGFRSYVRCLRSGKALYSLTDEDFGRERSVLADFFAHEKSTLTTTARLSVLTDAAVIPLVTLYDWSEGKYKVRFGEPVRGLAGDDSSAEVDASFLNQSLEQLLAESPAEYMWTLKIYRSVLPRKAYKFSQQHR